MKREHHTLEQIIHKLRQADAELAAGQPIAASCQKLGVAEATFPGAPGLEELEVAQRPWQGKPAVA